MRGQNRMTKRCFHFLMCTFTCKTYAQSARERGAETEQQNEDWRKEMALLALPPEPSPSEAGVVSLRF